MFRNELFLLRYAHRYQENVRLAIANLSNNTAFLRSIKKSIMRSNDVCSGALRTQLHSRLRCYPRCTAQKIQTITLLPAQRANLVDEVDAANALFERLTHFLRSPNDTNA